MAWRNPIQRDAEQRLYLSRLEDDLEREEFRCHGWARQLNARAIFVFWEGEPGLFGG